MGYFGDVDIDTALEDNFHKIAVLYFQKNDMVCTILDMSGKKELSANSDASTNIP
jgi:hypothetical protein